MTTGVRIQMDDGREVNFMSPALEDLFRINTAGSRLSTPENQKKSVRLHECDDGVYRPAARRQQATA